MIVGTPAALTSELNATCEGRIVHNKAAATQSMTRMALRGSFLSDTWEIQPDHGKTPSRATAQMRREDATPDTAVFSINPTMQTIFSKMWARPIESAYNWTKGCGAVNPKMSSRLGIQNRNKITIGSPRRAEATADENMPLALVMLALFVSSAMWPLAS